MARSSSRNISQRYEAQSRAKEREYDRSLDRAASSAVRDGATRWAGDGSIGQPIYRGMRDTAREKRAARSMLEDGWSVGDIREERNRQSVGRFSKGGVRTDRFGTDADVAASRYAQEDRARFDAADNDERRAVARIRATQESNRTNEEFSRMLDADAELRRREETEQSDRTRFTAMLYADGLVHGGEISRANIAAMNARFGTNYTRAYITRDNNNLQGAGVMVFEGSDGVNPGTSIVRALDAGSALEAVAHHFGSGFLERYGSRIDTNKFYSLVDKLNTSFKAGDNGTATVEGLDRQLERDLAANAKNNARPSYDLLSAAKSDTTRRNGDAPADLPDAEVLKRAMTGSLDAFDADDREKIANLRLDVRDNAQYLDELYAKVDKGLPLSGDERAAMAKAQSDLRSMRNELADTFVSAEDAAKAKADQEREESAKAAAEIARGKAEDAGRKAIDERVDRALKRIDDQVKSVKERLDELRSAEKPDASRITDMEAELEELRDLRGLITRDSLGIRSKPELRQDIDELLDEEGGASGSSERNGQPNARPGGSRWRIQG